MLRIRHCQNCRRLTERSQYLCRAAAPTCSLLKVITRFRPLLIRASGLPVCPCCCGAGGTLALASHGAGGTFEALSSSGMEAPAESAFPRARASSSLHDLGCCGAVLGIPGHAPLSEVLHLLGALLRYPAQPSGRSAHMQALLLSSTLLTPYHFHCYAKIIPCLRHCTSRST